MASYHFNPLLSIIFPCILLLLSSTVSSHDQQPQGKVVLPPAPSPAVTTPAISPPPPTKYPVKPPPPSPTPPAPPVKPPSPAPPVKPPSPAPPVNPPSPAPPVNPPSPTPPVKPPSPTPPVKLPPTVKLPPYSPPLPPVKSKKDCIPLCDKRCALHSRKRVCMRACMTCCDRCKCVPPGTFGNRELCGKCYTDMTTHGNRSKCP